MFARLLFQTLGYIFPLSFFFFICASCKLFLHKPIYVYFNPIKIMKNFTFENSKLHARKI